MAVRFILVPIIYYVAAVIKIQTAEAERQTITPARNPLAGSFTFTFNVSMSSKTYDKSV